MSLWLVNPVSVDMSWSVIDGWTPVTTTVSESSGLGVGLLAGLYVRP